MSTVPLGPGPSPVWDEDEDGDAVLGVSFCGVSMVVGKVAQVDGMEAARVMEPIDSFTATVWLTRCLYGLPCHDDPLLYSAGRKGLRWRNAVGWLEPDSSGRAPIDAWPSWFLDGVVLDLV